MIPGYLVDLVLYYTFDKDKVYITVDPEISHL